MKRYIVLNSDNIITTEIFTAEPISKPGVYETQVGKLGDTVSVMQNGTVVVTNEYVYVPPTNTILSKLEFQRRFTQAERIGIRAARAISPELDDFMELLNSADNVDLTDPTLVAGMNILAQAGLITNERKAIILAVL